MPSERREAARARHYTPPLRGRKWLGVFASGLLLFLLVQLLQVRDEFSFTRPPLEVQAQHLESPLGRLVAGPLHDQQAGDQGQVDLDPHAVLAGGQEMLAAEDTFEPAKKEFLLPAILPPKGVTYIGRPHRAT